MHKVMKKKEDIHDELREQAPFLTPLKKGDDGFRVPADYFDNLEVEVFRQLDAISAQRTPTTFTSNRKGLSWWQFMQRLWQPRVALAFAGVIALILTAWWYFTPSPTAITPPIMAAAEISADDAEAYLMDNLLELEPEQIALVLPADELPAITLEKPGNTNPAANRELQLHPDDLDDLLNDMSDEELESLLL